MPADLPKTLLKFLIALLKHQAKQWLGEEALGIAAQTLIDEELQKRLDDWLMQEETARRLLQAAENARLWLQDPRNCPDDDLRGLFRDLSFGDLPAVQEALRNLPSAMNTAAITDALRADFARTLPNLTPEQREQSAQLYTEALLHAVLPLREYTLPVVAQISLRILAEQRREFAELQRKADEILQRLKQGQQADAATLAEAIRSGQIIVYGNVQNSILLIGANNAVTLNAAQLLRQEITIPGDLPPGSYLPFLRNLYFTAREETLAQLARSLCSADEVSTQALALTQSALVGKGGVGKTQLARVRLALWLLLSRRALDQPGASTRRYPPPARPR